MTQFIVHQVTLLTGLRVAIGVDPAHNGIALAAAPVAALIAWQLVASAREAAMRRADDQAERLLAEVAPGARPLEPGRAKLVVFFKKDCEPCSMLDQAIL